MQKGVILGCGNRSNAGMDTVTLHTSNFNSRFVSMSELELFLLTRVLTPNFNTMDLVQILEKIKNLTFRS
jgi:hypothetical protein